jgi:Uma2 family endonuclease
MAISAETYERVALEDPDGRWELVCGALRQKPTMTQEHNRSVRTAARLLIRQLDERQFTVDAGQTKVRTSAGAYFVPDLCVIPVALERRAAAMRPGGLEVFEEALPLIVEAWSPSTGDYDVMIKLPEYQRRGDAEIWLIHPYERWLKAWRRRPDGSYTETLYRGDVTVEPVALPGVAIGLAALFE